MRAATLFSGIGAPECAAPWIDWRWSAEIDPFAAAVHAARFPGTPNLGDVNRIDPDATEPVDLVVFGSPCQSFSGAGKRLGLDDPRGNLALVALRLVERLRPRWFVFENVPGLLSSDGGRDFGTFLGTVEQCGYGWAYRTLDAQFAGVPQRRRRVFVVGCLGDWRAAAAVLFEPESLRGDTAPRREAGERIARPVAGCLEGGSGYRNDADTADNLIGFHPTLRQPEFGNYEDCSPTLRHEASAVAMRLNAHAGRIDGESETFVLRSDAAIVPVALNLRGREGGSQFEADDLASLRAASGGSSRSYVQPIPLQCNGGDVGFNLPSLRAGNQHITGGGPAVAFRENVREDGAGRGTPKAAPLSVRRLTPREAERLQGFPDDFTAISYRGKPAADGPRYRALGNSMAVPVIGWVLGRIREVAA